MIAVHQSDPNLTGTRIVADALKRMLKKGRIEMGTQNRFQLLDYRPLEIDRRDRLLLAFRIRFLLSAHIVQMTSTLP
jgi:hypothetical protein